MARGWPIAIFLKSCKDLGKGNLTGTIWRRQRDKAAEFNQITRKKRGVFSATKAVKALARERVGQPKPVRVEDVEKEKGRKMKHKPRLQDVMEEKE